MHGKEYNFGLFNVWFQYVMQAGLEFLIFQSLPPKCRDHMRNYINFLKLFRNTPKYNRSINGCRPGYMGKTGKIK